MLRCPLPSCRWHPVAAEMVPIHHPDLMGPAVVAEEVPKVRSPSNTLLAAAEAPRLLHPVLMDLVVMAAVVAGRVVGARTLTTKMAATLLSRLCPSLACSSHGAATQRQISRPGR